ncbi:MAG: hypothetical protein EOO40_06305 [Deltaproteobacteria bacterium]|nr:MAG: hypothetical protein EOO40_06305 [Deltaproteobacteria bacterium]
MGVRCAAAAAGAQAALPETHSPSHSTGARATLPAAGRGRDAGKGCDHIDIAKAPVKAPSTYPQRTSPCKAACRWLPQGVARGRVVGLRMLPLLSRLFCALPHFWAYRLADALAFVWYHLLPVRRAVASRNVARVFGDSLSAAQRRHIVRRSCVNLCYYGIEALRAPLLTEHSSAELVNNEQMRHVDAYLAAGRGVIAVTAHLGSFDLLGSSQAMRGYPVHALLKDIGWPAAARFWRRVRTQSGLGCIAPRQSARQILRLLRANQVVAFSIDQHLPAHRSIVCRFFGQWAATTPAPVRFAMQTGAPIVPIFIVREPQPGYHRIMVLPQLLLEQPYAEARRNVRHNTERLNRVIESMVVAYPTQWLWQHRRWKVQDNPQGWELPEDKDAAAS